MTATDGRFPKGWGSGEGRVTGPLALDDDTAERILHGAVAPDDAPPGYSRVSEMVAVLQAAPTAAEIAPSRYAFSAAAPRPRRSR